MVQFRKKLKLNRLISFALLAFFVLLIKKPVHANASDFSANVYYNKKIVTDAVEVTVSVESDAELSLAKYASGRITDISFFTESTKNSTSILNTKNDDEYTFFVRENGYYSVYVCTEDKEEALLIFNVKTVDETPPELSTFIEEEDTGFYLHLNATDNSNGPLKIQYVQGSYPSSEHTIWKNAEQIENNTSLFFKYGTYTFLVTDKAGNTYLTIEKYSGESETAEEFRAVWISYLDFDTSGYTKESFQEHIDKMYDDVVKMNMNAVVVHVRPFGDAMYPSEYFPWSKYVSGKQGKDPGFDPLEIMIKSAHKRGLEFHAWLNPYRITSSSTNVNDLSVDNPARVYRTDKSKTNDRYVLTYDGKLYYNPSVPQVQTLIVNGIKEIVTNYEVDGIHFDDYFYPSLGKNFTSNFDAPEYETYKKEQINAKKEYMSIADWRRNNVNTLVSSVYASIKEINPNVIFGISPGGFIDSLSADDKYYVDYETWMGYDGYIDYICPQLYWSNQHSIYPFNDTLDRFLSITRNPNVKFYVGVGAYKAGIKTEGTDWYTNKNVLRNMIRYARTNDVDGFIIYSYRSIMQKQTFSAIRNMFLEFN